MAFVVKEFFANSTFQVPPGVTHLWYQFIDDPDNVQKAIQAPAFGNTFCLYNRIDGSLLGAGAQTGTTRPFGNNSVTSSSIPVNIQPALQGHKIYVAFSNVGGVQNTSQFYQVREGAAVAWGLYVWGYNGFGELGTNDAITKTTPVGLTALPYHSIQGDQNCVMMLMKDGSVLGTGLNNNGQLGDGTTASRSTPTAILSGSSFLHIQTQAGQTIGLTTDGQVFGWGVNPPAPPYNVNRSVPTLCSVLPTVRDIAGAGVETNTLVNFQYILLGIDNSLWTWGTGLTGSLGDGTATGTRYSPVQINGPFGLAPTTVGYPIKVRTTRHNAGYLTSAGEVVLWGDNTMGAVGDGTTNSRSSPTLVTGHKFIDFQLGVATSNSTGHVLALKADGSVWRWGKSLSTLSATAITTPTQISSPTDRFIGIINTSNNHFAIKEDGSLWGLGVNTVGELATGNTSIVATLTQLTNLGSNGTQGGSGIGKQIYGVDTQQQSGMLEVTPGKTIGIRLGGRSMIDGRAIVSNQGSALAPNNAGFSYPYFFSRKCIIGWAE